MDLWIPSLFGLLGAVLGASLAGMHQRRSTERIIEAELKKVLIEMESQSAVRFKGRKEDWLLETVAELVTETDPELHQKFNYKKIVGLIHRVQIILDPRNETQATINHWSSHLGFAIRDAMSGERDIDRILKAQDGLIEATRDFFAP